MDHQTCFSIDIITADTLNLPNIIVTGLRETLQLLSSYSGSTDAIINSHFDKFDELGFRTRELSDYLRRFIPICINLEPDMTVTRPIVSVKYKNLCLLYQYLEPIIDEYQLVLNNFDNLDILSDHMPYRNSQYRATLSADYRSLNTCVRAIVAAIRVLEPGLDPQQNIVILPLQWWEPGFAD